MVLGSFMNELIELLKNNNIEYNIGIISDGYFYRTPKVLEDKMVIELRWKKNSIDKLFSKFNSMGIVLNEENVWKYGALYKINGTENKILITYIVNSHVQLPELLLKKFKTSNFLYFIDASDKIRRSSPSTYNTKIGYYSLLFEDYLSQSYEKLLAEIIHKGMLFVNGEIEKVQLPNFRDGVNKLFLMSVFRNPKCVKDINKNSLTAILIDGGLSPEYLAEVGEKMNSDFIKGYIPVPLVNDTSKGMVTVKSLISSFNIDFGIPCMIMVVHPKFAVVLIPNDYYDKMVKEQGNNIFLLINNETAILNLNTHIYHSARINKDEVIGIKDDLDSLIKLINDNKK